MTQETMTQAEQGKATFHRWFGEAWNKGNYDVAYEIIHPRMRVHGAGGQPVEQGPDGLKGLISTWRDAFPDGHMEVNGLIAEGDLVAAILTWRGTHQGEFYGVKPTGKQVVCTSIGIDRVQDGVIVDGWGELDMLGMMQQMGAMAMAGPGNTANGLSAEWGQSTAGPEAGSIGTPEENKAVALSFAEALNAPDPAAYRALVDEARYREHNPIWGGNDLASGLVAHAALRAALPDYHYDVDRSIVIAEGDRVCIHGVVRGHHSGAELFGHAASSNEITFTQTDLLRVRDGKVIERWVSADNMAAFQQVTA